MRAALFLIALAALALAPIAAPWLQFVLTLAVAKGFAALGVAVLLRGGLISIGHAMFYAVSAYAIAFLARAGLNEFVVLLLLGTLASALAGLLVGAFLVRYRAIFFAMLNLAMSMVLYALLSKLYGITGGIGFLVAIVLFASIREHTEDADCPKAFRGFPIALISAGLLALAFMGFSGIKIFG